MEVLKEFKIINWNIAGAKYLEEPKKKREVFRKKMNEELKTLIKHNKPHVVTLQEIVQYEEDGKRDNKIIDIIDEYDYHFSPLIDTESLSIRAKWNKSEKSGGWPRGTYFAQGNGFLFKKDLPHQPVWALPRKVMHPPRVKRKNYIEKVSLESGLYFGDRDTEPRAALVAHFVYNDKNEKPLDIFVVNLHLTTLTKEREGIPEIDRRATKIRLGQLNIIFDGIVSRYNSWRRDRFPERGKHRKPEDWESFKRYEPIWILAGDFNATPESIEYNMLQEVNFMDMVDQKGHGTKSPGAGKRATLVLDYVFAGPKYLALDPLVARSDIKGNGVSDIRVSDHSPMNASIPIYWR